MASGTGIGEFYVSLFVDAAEGGLTVSNLVQGFGQLEIATVAEIGLLWELGTMLARFTDAGIKASLGFEQFTMHTGLSAQELQHWQIVAEQSHASAQDVSGSVENLTKHLANLAIGIPDASLGSLQQLGISAFDAGGKLKNAFDILGEVRTRLSAVTQDAGQQERILAGLGISPNLRETLLLSDSMFAQRRSLVPGMSEEQETQFDNLRETMIEIELKTRQIGINIGAWISPAVQKLFDVLNAIAGFELTGGKAWVEAFKRGHEELERAEKSKELPDFHKSALGQLIYGVEEKTPRVGALQLQDLGLPPPPGERGANNLTIDKHDTYVIQEANNPEKIKQVLEQHWDDTLRQKTVDGFDRQHNNGGY